jgi:hypothetical protein
MIRETLRQTLKDATMWSVTRDPGWDYPRKMEALARVSNVHIALRLLSLSGPGYMRWGATMDLTFRLIEDDGSVLNVTKSLRPDEFHTDNPREAQLLLCELAYKAILDSEFFWAA